MNAQELEFQFEQLNLIHTRLLFLIQEMHLLGRLSYEGKISLKCNYFSR